MAESSQILHDRAAAGDQNALAEAFAADRDRLRRMIHVRMDPRLQGRIDPSDVLQETFLDAQRRLGELATANMPLLLWLRLLAGQRLVDLHRFHLGAQRRTADREVSLHHGQGPHASSLSLAAVLMDEVSSPSGVAVREELKGRVHAALEAMNPLDREVLALRHFENLSNGETATLLGLSKQAASNRYVRALDRLTTVLSAENES